MTSRSRVVALGAVVGIAMSDRRRGPPRARRRGRPDPEGRRSLAAAGGVAVPGRPGRAERRRLAGVARAAAASLADHAAAPLDRGGDQRALARGPGRRRLRARPPADGGGRSRGRSDRRDGRRRRDRGDHAGAVHLLRGRGPDPGRAQPTASARLRFGWLALAIGMGVAFAALLLVVARVGVGRLLTALPLHLQRPPRRTAEGRRRRDRSVARDAAGSSPGAGGLRGVAPRRLARSGRRDLARAPHCSAGRSPGSAALAIESLAASARGAAFVGARRDRRPGGGAGGGGRRVRRPGAGGAGARGDQAGARAAWSARRRSSPGRLPSGTASPASGGCST